MVDVLDMPTQSFGYVPTPALVAPIEFTLRVSDYKALGGHIGHIRSVDDVNRNAARQVAQNDSAHDPTARRYFRWSARG